jgi:hypothetical protein
MNCENEHPSTETDSKILDVVWNSRSIHYWGKILLNSFGAVMYQRNGPLPSSTIGDIKWNTAKLHKKKAPKKGPLPRCVLRKWAPFTLEMRWATTFHKVGDGPTEGLFQWLLVYWTIIDSHY